jgi:hypothetical protein
MADINHGYFGAIATSGCPLVLQNIFPKDCLFIRVVYNKKGMVKYMEDRKEVPIKNSF